MTWQVKFIVIHLRALSLFKGDRLPVLRVRQTLSSHSHPDSQLIQSHRHPPSHRLEYLL